MNLNVSRSDARGISSIFATLILLVLAVSSGTLIYSYFMGYVSGFSPRLSGNSLMIQSTSNVGGSFVIYAKNIGAGSLNIQNGGGAHVYVDNRDVGYTSDIDEIPEGKVCAIRIIGSLGDSGRTVNIKVVTSDGTFASIDTKIQ